MIGDFTPGKAVRCRFNTHKADGTPITLAGTPAVSVYKGSTTESTAGVTLTVDYDGRTGLHDVVVDTSADGTFYAAGNDFDLVITAGTVDSISVVGTVVGSFSLSNRSGLRPSLADRTLDVSAGGEAGIDWANVGSPTTAVDLSGTTVKTATDVEADTADIQSRIGAAGAGLTNVPWNASWDAEVESEVADALAAYDPPTNAEMEARTLASASYATAASLATVAGYLDTEIAAILEDIGTTLPAQIAALNNLSAAQVNAEVDAALADVGLTAAVTGRIDAAVSSRLAAADYTAAPSAAAVSAQVAADLAAAHGAGSWTTATGFSTLDAAGVRGAVGLAAANLDTQLAAIDDYLDTEMAAVKAKTDLLPASPAATGDIPTAAEVADRLLGRSLAGGADGGRTVQDALRFLRNRWVRTATALTVYQEDDATAAWTSTLVSAAVNPATSSDPA